jgi:hypothetical protein
MKRNMKCSVLCAASLLLLSFSPFADKSKDSKHYGLIFGTAYGLDHRPLYGARIEIHPVGQKRPAWELMSDHQGEFAQRVPPGPADYLVTGQAEVSSDVGTGQKKIKIKGDKKVHIEAEERQDISLQLTR